MHPYCPKLLSINVIFVLMFPSSQQTTYQFNSTHPLCILKSSWKEISSYPVGDDIFDQSEAPRVCRQTCRDRYRATFYALQKLNDTSVKCHCAVTPPGGSAGGCTLTCGRDGSPCGGHDNQYSAYPVCANGLWGRSCNQSCPVNCLGQCGMSRGDCLGCSFHYFGRTCEEACSWNCVRGCDQFSGRCVACARGWYGVNCTDKCSSNCNTIICDRLSGICDGCKTGFYQPKCSEKCSDGCVRGTCSHDDGVCEGGCHDDWYGPRCDKLCPRHCREHCDRQSGLCDQCVAGYHGNMCEISCPVSCKNSECHRSNGSCIQGCEVGYYGPYCSQNCSEGCRSAACRSSDGTCVACEDGLYGPACSTRCPRACADNLCNFTTGSCTKGCQSGWDGAKCGTDINECLSDNLHRCASLGHDYHCHNLNGSYLCCQYGVDGFLCRGVPSTDLSAATITGICIIVMAAVVLVIIVIVFIRKKLSDGHQLPPLFGRSSSGRSYDFAHLVTNQADGPDT